MEYVEGETLQRKIGQQPVETGELVRIALQRADAMEAAHAKGITTMTSRLHQEQQARSRIP